MSFDSSHEPNEQHLGLNESSKFAKYISIKFLQSIQANQPSQIKIDDKYTLEKSIE